MTTAAGQPRPYATWLAHHRQHILWAWFFVVAVAQILPRDSLLPMMLTVPTVMLLFASLAAAVRHNGILCPRCMADFPLDGSEEAERRMPWLRAYHHHRLWLNLVFFVLSIGCFAVSWLFIPVAAMNLLDFRMDSIHRRLCPWCPWCNPNRGRGDRSFTPPPVPVRTGDQ